VQLKLQRSQRSGGVFGKAVVFCLDARAEYSPSEAANISKYRLGGEVVYSSQAARRHLENVGRHLDRSQQGSAAARAGSLVRGAASLALAKMQLNISIASLGRGHHIECKDLEELLEAENALMNACRRLKEYLATAASFSGSVILVDFDDNEKVHVSQGLLEFAPAPAPPVKKRAPTVIDAAPAYEGEPQSLVAAQDIMNGLRMAFEHAPSIFKLGGAALGAGLLFAVFGEHTWTILAAICLMAGAGFWAMHR